MNIPRVYLFRISLVFALACSRGYGQASATITTKFEKDATLTTEQVQSVLQLASECGLSEPTEIAIGHTRPLNRRFVFVKGKERVSGNRISYDEVCVFYSVWAKLPKDAKAKQLNDFWVNPPYLSTFEFAEIQVAGKPVRVQMPSDIGVETAEHIFGAFAERKVRFKDKPDKWTLDMVASAKPRTLSYLKELNQYSLVFEHGVVARVKLSGKEVVITENPTMVTY